MTSMSGHEHALLRPKTRVATTKTVKGGHSSTKHRGERAFNCELVFMVRPKIIRSKAHEIEMAARSSDDAGRDFVERMSDAAVMALRNRLENLPSNAIVNVTADDSIIHADPVSTPLQATAVIVAEVPTAPLASPAGTIDSFFQPSAYPTTITSVAVPEPDIVVRVGPSSSNAAAFECDTMDTDEDENFECDITDAEDGGGGANAAGEKRKRNPQQEAKTHVKVCIIYDKTRKVSNHDLVERYNLTESFIWKILYTEKATHERFEEEIKVMQLHQDNIPKKDIMNMDWKHLGRKGKGENRRRLCYTSLQKIVNEEYMLDLARTYIRCGQAPS